MRRAASERYTFQERLAGSLDVTTRKSPRPPCPGLKVAAGGAVNRQGSICLLPVLKKRLFVPYIKMTLGTFDHSFVCKCGLQ